MAKTQDLVIGRMEIEGWLDDDGEIRLELYGCSSDESYTYIRREDAVRIIDHLKAVFEIEDEATQALKLECVKQIWDHRQCPSCGHSFIPFDRTRQETLDTLNSLFPNDPMRGGSDGRS